MLDIEKIITEELDKILAEAPMNIGNIPDKPVAPQPGTMPARKVSTQPITKSAPKRTVQPAQKTVDKAPLNMPSKEPAREPEPTKPSIPMKKIEYQIFNIKMRMNKLGLTVLTNRFNQSLKDFDLSVTKNTKDPEKIDNYLLPVMGNLEALKNALKSLEGEFEKLQEIIGGDE